MRSVSIPPDLAAHPLFGTFFDLAILEECGIPVPTGNRLLNSCNELVQSIRCGDSTSHELRVMAGEWIDTLRQASKREVMGLHSWQTRIWRKGETQHFAALSVLL